MSRQYYTDAFESGPLYVEGLKNNSMITTEQASFFIGNTDEQSFCDLGAYDVNAIKDADANNIRWVDMP